MNNRRANKITKRELLRINYNRDYEAINYVLNKVITDQQIQKGYISNLADSVIRLNETSN
jgi:hypothetical protein